MLIHSETLEECPTTGTMVVQWVRKFPFFCSDREYIIGRRIWESGRSYYCVTKVLRVLDYSRISRHLLVTAGDDGTVHLWDTTSRNPK
ncbi:protein nedd1, partial [Quercus suber]